MSATVSRNIQNTPAMRGRDGGEMDGIHETIAESDLPTIVSLAAATVGNIA
jgi:hypothetical protein